MSLTSAITEQWHRLGLSADKRHYLMSVIKEYTASNQAIFQIFDHLHKTDPNPAVKEIAKRSKNSIRERKPFASQWRDTGYFNEEEQRLMIVGETYDCLGKVCEFFLRDSKSSHVVFDVLGNSTEWIIVIFACIAMAIVGLEYQELFDKDGDLFIFALASFLLNWGHYILALLGLAVFFYVWAASNLTGPARTLLKGFGCFRFHEAELELKALDICAALVGSSMPPGSIVDALAGAFYNEQHILRSLKQAKKSLAETRFTDVMALFISPTSLLHIRSKAPDETPSQLSEGFELASRMLQLEQERSRKILRNGSSAIFMGLALAVSVPLLIALLGGGMID